MRLMQTTLLNEGPADFEGDLSVETLTDTTVPLRQYHGTRYQHATRRSELMYSGGLKERTARNLKKTSAVRLESVLATSPWQESVEDNILRCRVLRNKARGVPDDSTTAKGRIYLCQKVCQYDPNGPVKSATCSQIWHDLWRGRSSIPPGLKTIRVRAPTGCARRGASESGIQEESESSAEETGSASSDSGVLQIAYI
ncbi:hypothetical protein GQ600_7620 [Phytophthora cactorum]|nr:hypothetical protein GQ600_7620 [Phytophthora cactorum]